jgi:hypothetical protein
MSEHKHDPCEVCGRLTGGCCTIGYQMHKDFPYPGERMTASQNDLLATEEEKRHAQATVAYYVELVERLERRFRSFWRREQMIGDRE